MHTIQDCITPVWTLAKTILEKVCPPKHNTGVVQWGGSVSKLCTPWKEPYSIRTEVVCLGLQKPSAGGRVVETPMLTSFPCLRSSVKKALQPWD